MKNKALVLGSSGLIGHHLCRAFGENNNFKLFNIANSLKFNDETILINALNIEKLKEKIEEIQPDYIFNCIGILNDKSENDPTYTIFLNAYLPNLLGDIAKTIGAKLIHFSTDCVFSGNKKDPYKEDDSIDANDLYGLSKGLGENILRDHLVIRTSFIGPSLREDSQELFSWFMSQKGTINGYTKSIWSGVTASEAARATEKLLSLDISGIYHLTNNQPISKYDLLCMFKKYSNKNIEIIKVDGRESDKSFIDTRSLLEYEIPSYDAMISSMVKDTLNNKQLYSHYSFD
tara:strand:- start:2943 stop:3809 length:867 start_codon:yes stop_codon:yes gene_type:complete